MTADDAGSNTPPVLYDGEEIAAVFGRSAFEYDTVIPFFVQLGERLVELAELRPGEHVLDVGCGRGATLFPAAERVTDEGSVLGVDLSAEMVLLVTSEIQQRGVSNASVQRMDAAALDVEPEAFDVVLCSFVLHLLPDPDAAAASFSRALRPGGRCVASVPAGAGQAWDFLGRLFVSFAGRYTGRPPIPHRPDFDLPGVLSAVGLEVVRNQTVEVEFHFADEDAVWSWLWSHGMRGLLELLAPDDLDDFRQKLFGELRAIRTPEGIPMRQRAVCVVARKDSSTARPRPTPP